MLLPIFVVDVYHLDPDAMGLMIRRGHPASDSGPALEVHGLPFEGCLELEVVQHRRS